MIKVLLLATALGAAADPVTKWQVRMTPSKGDTATFGPPTPLGDKVVFFVVDSATNSTWLAALDSSTGEQVWKVQTTFVQPASGWVEAGKIHNDTTLALFAGTDTGVIAVSAETGALIWTYDYGSIQEVPSHPTFFRGRVFLTFENGNFSSPIIALEANSGAKIFETEDLAFTKIWPTKEGLLVYCSLDPDQPSDSNVGVVARNVDGKIVWSHYHVAATELNNNPNLDVGDAGVFMYSKPRHDLRYITLFATVSGEKMWELETVGDVGDYDTFTWGGRFFRLMSQNDTSFFVQAIDVEKNILWTSHFSCTDMNMNLLVGGNAVFGVAIDSNAVYAFDADDGHPLWQLSNIYQPQDGSISEDGTTLFIGDGNGVLHSILIRS